MHVEILEQPISWGYCFQYEYQPRVYLWGNSSTAELKTYPRIKISGYNGRAMVRVSCVTKTPAYRPHPCMLDGPDCRNGVVFYNVHCESHETIVSFPKISIMEHSQPSTIIEDALQKRKEMNVDPFKTGFNHTNYVRTLIDLNEVRLCFEVFAEDESGVCNVQLQAVVSNIINNRNVIWSSYAFSVLKLSERKCPADGGSKDIILYCDKQIPKDTRVRFFEIAENGRVIWECYSSLHVYRSAKLYFKPPKYRNLVITEPVSVLMQLRRMADSSCSEAMTFQYLPLDTLPPRLYSTAASRPHPPFVYQPLSIVASLSDSNQLTPDADCSLLECIFFRCFK